MRGEGARYAGAAGAGAGLGGFDSCPSSFASGAGSGNGVGAFARTGASRSIVRELEPRDGLAWTWTRRQNSRTQHRLQTQGIRTHLAQRFGLRRRVLIFRVEHDLPPPLNLVPACARRDRRRRQKGRRAHALICRCCSHARITACRRGCRPDFEIVVIIVQTLEHSLQRLLPVCTSTRRAASPEGVQLQARHPLRHGSCPLFQPLLVRFMPSSTRDPLKSSRISSHAQARVEDTQQQSPKDRELPRLYPSRSRDPLSLARVLVVPGTTAAAIRSNLDFGGRALNYCLLVV